ncbi:MAG: hypothetical protein IT350_16370 [Deltaproteobacteria bacterium]|nr:hypothetical protein [Deltaproteobacteria bacterium]
MDRVMQALILFGIAAALAIVGCDDLDEQHEDGAELGADPSNDPHDVSKPWEYPYHLVIGGGLSETLSVLTVQGPGDWSIANDVQDACAGINQMTWRDGRLFALCSLSNSLVTYDAEDLSITGEVSLGDGRNPMNFAFDGDDRIHVSNFLTNDVTLHDLDDGSTLATVPLPYLDEAHLDNPDSETWPRPGSLIPDGDRLLVAVANLSAQFTPGGPGAIHVVDTTAHAVAVEVLLAGRDTTTLLASPGAQCVFALSAGDYAVGTGFAGNGVVECLDPATLAPLAVIETGGAPMGESVAAPNGRVYVGNAMDARILVFDSATLEIRPEIDLRGDTDGPELSFVSGIAVDGNGFLYATDFNHDRLFIVDTNTNEILAKFDTCDGPDTLEFVR